MTTREVPGLKELGEFLLHTLPDGLRKRFLARAAFNAAEKFYDRAREIVRVRTGNVQQHIAVFRRRTSSPDVVQYGVGVRKLKLNVKEKKLLRMIRRAHQKISIAGDPYYYYYLEHGTSKMPAYPFLRPSWDEKQQPAIDAFRDTMKDGVDEIKGKAA